MTTPDLRRTLASSPEVSRGLWRLVDASPFRASRTWPHVVAIVRTDEKRVTTRADFAAWLRANDLPGLARECMNRRVGPGELLVWLDLDVPGFAFAGFVVGSVSERKRGRPSVSAGTSGISALDKGREVL